MSLRIRLIDEPAAEAIAAGRCPPGRRCAPDYPAAADRIAARMFLERCAAGLDPRPYGHFLVCLADGDEASDGAANELTIGGIGFHGGIDAYGRVEIGYAIVPSHQSAGHATAALPLLIETARRLGAKILTAETGLDRVTSQRILRHHGFTPTGSTGGALLFELALR